MCELSEVESSSGRLAALGAELSDQQGSIALALTQLYAAGTPETAPAHTAVRQSVLVQKHTYAALDAFDFPTFTAGMLKLRDLAAGIAQQSSAALRDELAQLNAAMVQRAAELLNAARALRNASVETEAQYNAARRVLGETINSLIAREHAALDAAERAERDSQWAELAVLNTDIQQSITDLL
jgi:hypothetical protein